MILKANLKKMETYVDEQYAICILAGHEDINSHVAIGETLSPMTSSYVELTYSKEDIKRP